MKRLLLQTIFITIVFYSNAQTVTDIDNNVYNTVTIGTQVWMAENLKTTRYSNGDSIGTTTSNVYFEDTPKYQWAYDYNESNVAIYGRLYTWYAVTDSRNVCPTGWHVPNDGEWTILTDYLIDNGYGFEGSGTDIGKSMAATSGWKTDQWEGRPGNDQASNNSSGFTALPGGHRNLSGFDNIEQKGYWWSSTEGDYSYQGWDRELSYNLGIVFRISSSNPDGLSVRCAYGVIPVLTTTAVKDFTSTSVTCGGNIINDVGEAVITRGVCWSTSANPTIADSKTTDGAGAGKFTSIMTDLQVNTKYYVRAYATNSEGTGYGNEICFSTRGETGNLSDNDGNEYSTIEIGTQTWMAENLKTTKFNDGISIPLVMFTEWNNLTTPAYCWHNNDELGHKDKYGALYNWYTVNTCKICPSGWHVPTDAEWTTLTTYLGGESVAGGKMKGTDFWQSPNTGATNESGFAARPGACRLDDFSLTGSSGYWWSSSEFDKNNAWFRLLSYNSGGVLSSINGKTAGFSVRCIKDNNTSMTNSFNPGEMIFYPNPAADRLYLKNNNYANTIILIFDLQGRQVLSKQLDSNPIDISNLGKGIYITKLVGSENFRVNKFIKQ